LALDAIRIRADRDTPLGGVFGGLALVVCLLTGLLGLDHLPVSLCAFKAFTGQPCMTCGTTRSLGRLYALDLRGALAMNPLATLGTLALLAWGILDLFFLRKGRFLSIHLSKSATRIVRVAAVAVLLANWAYLVAVGR
jgi:hypothetical protein